MLRQPGAATLNHIPLGLPCAGVFLPHPAAAEVGVAIVAKLYSVWQLAQKFRVAATEHYVIRDEGKLELSDAEQALALPHLLPQALKTRFTQYILDDTAFVRQIAQLQLKHVFLPNQRRAETGTQSQKEHSSATIAAER